MTIAGTILLAIGVVFFFVEKNQRAKASHIKSARPAQAAELRKMAADIAQEIGAGNWRDYVKVRGRITAAEPLRSELTQQPCVYYKMTVTREYEETVNNRSGRGSSSSTRRGSETVASNTRSIPFVIEDASGKIAVDPDGAKIDTVEVLDEFRPDQASGGVISYGGFSISPRLGPNMGGRRTIGYRYVESVLPLDQSVVVVGAVSDTTGEVTLRQPVDGEKKLIISSKTFEALAASAERGARYTRNAMFVFLGIGLALLLVGVF